MKQSLRNVCATFLADQYEWRNLNQVKNFFLTFVSISDDRFVMKQMSRQELQCFLEFAPHYFQYVNKAVDEQVNTPGFVLIIISS